PVFARLRLPIDPVLADSRALARGLRREGRLSRSGTRPMLRFGFALLTLLSGPALADGADADAVARIHGGIVDCVACNLKSADLRNTCVKAHDLHGADFDGADATLMCMSYANFSGATFRGTDLSGANLAHADLDGADLSGARMTITSIK